MANQSVSLAVLDLAIRAISMQTLSRGGPLVRIYGLDTMTNFYCACCLEDVVMAGRGRGHHGNGELDDGAVATKDLWSGLSKRFKFEMKPESFK